MSTKRGGRRVGAGRPKGSLEESTKIRNAAKRAYTARIAENADRLYNAQFSLATGLQILFRIDTDNKGKRLPAVQVIDQEEIKRYLDGQVDENSYYFIATQKPDNHAIKDMLDRAFGRPEEKLDLTSYGRRIETPKIISIIKPRKQANVEAEGQTS